MYSEIYRPLISKNLKKLFGMLKEILKLANGKEIKA